MWMQRWCAEVGWKASGPLGDDLCEEGGDTLDCGGPREAGDFGEGDGLWVSSRILKSNQMADGAVGRWLTRQIKSKIHDYS